MAQHGEDGDRHEDVIARVDEDGIVHLQYLKSRITVADAKREIEISLHLTGGKRLFSLVDIRRVKSVDAAARAFFSGKEAGETYAAVALLVGNLVTRTIGQFFLGFNKPPMSLKLFTSEKDAHDWLLERKRR